MKEPNANEKENYQFSWAIPKCEIATINNEMTILFFFDLHSDISGKDWTFARSFDHIRQLFFSLSKTFLNLPKIQIPEIFSIKDKVNLNINRLKFMLEIFFKEIFGRPDILNSSAIRSFLELDNHLKDHALFQPVLLCEISDLKMEVGDIVYSPNESLLFVGCCYSLSASGISAYLSNLSSLWNNEDLGEIDIYHMVKSNYGEIHMERLYQEAVLSQVSRLHYIEGPSFNMLLAGLYSGWIEIFQIFSNYQSYASKNLVDKMTQLRPHYNKVIDFGVDTSIGFLYSAAINEKNVVITEINYEHIIKSVQISNSSIVNFVYDGENHRIFVADSANSIWLLQIEKAVNFNLLQAIHNQLPYLTALSVDTDRNFIFSGNGKGVICFYDIREKGNWNYEIAKGLELPLDKRNSVKVTEIKYKEGKNELIIALSNGTVQYWSHDDKYPEYVFHCHEKSISRILVDSSLKYVFTCSQDKTVKVWNMPAYWPSEMMRKNTLANERSIIEDVTLNANNLNLLKDAFKSDAFKMSFSPVKDETEKVARRLSSSADTPEGKNLQGEENNKIDIEYFDENNESSDKGTSSSLDGWDNDSLDFFSNPAKLPFFFSGP